MPTSRKTTATPSRPRAAKAKVPAKKGVSKAGAFKKNKPIELELPSGEVCLAKRPGLDTLLAEGVFSDGLMPIIQKAIDSGKSNGVQAELDEKEILKNPKLLRDVMSSYDKVLPLVVVEPVVKNHRRQDGVDSDGEPKWVTIPQSERDDDIVYTDEVDMLDKVFVFQWASGGSPDLAKFRQQLGEGVAALADVEGVLQSS